MKSLASSVLVACTVLACSASTPTSTPPVPAPTDAGSDAASPPPPVEWAACSLNTDGKKQPQAECATIQVPLAANNPNGPTIDYFVKRFRTSSGKGSRALWMLQGGPGASGFAMEGLAEYFASVYPDVDYYIPDHRGTGRSTRLGCKTEESPTSEEGLTITDAEWPSCLQSVTTEWGDRLKQFNVTNAANDVGVALARMKTEGQPTFVLGVSYGTYLAHRYAQLFPNQADGIVFDSMFPVGGSLAQQDADADEAARDFLGECAKNAFCRGKLGDDPWGKAQALLSKLKAGHCSEIASPVAPTHVLMRQAFGQFLMHPIYRRYIPAILYRLDRCEPRDVTALKYLVGQLTGPQPASPETRLWGWVLSLNITLSELWEQPAPTVAQLDAIRERSVASRDVTTFFEFNSGTWPTYPSDEYTGKWATSDAPMLFLNGGLDPATLLRKARVAKSQFTKPHQHWVEIPTAGHTALAGTSQTTDNRLCGTVMLMDFIENPKGELDTSCIAKVAPLEFEKLVPTYNQAFFGTSDPWE